MVSTQGSPAGSPSISSSSTSLRDLAVSAGINGGSTLLCLLAFAFLRLQPLGDRIYFPKLYLKGVRKSTQSNRFLNLNAKSYSHCLDWVWDAMRMSESELIEHSGLDSAVYLRAFLLGLKLFVPIMILGFVILVPINVTDTSLVKFAREGELSSANTDVLSMANVRDGSPRLWAHLLTTYVFTFWTFYLLYREYEVVSKMRSRFLMSQRLRPDKFTVLVRQIPKEANKSISLQVERFFRANHSEYYLCHQIVYDTNKLTRTVKDLEKAENYLTYLKQKSASSTKRPTMKKGFLGLYGEKVDAMDHYASEVERLAKEAMAERERVLNDDEAKLPVSFVSFSTRWGAAVCAQTQQSINPTVWLTEWAPEPREIYWRNVGVPNVMLYFRKVAVTGAAFALVFFFAIPVASVQALVNIESMESTFGSIIESETMKSILKGFLPGLALKLFLLVLPTVLMFLSKAEGHRSQSKLDMVSAVKQYYFTVISVFFVTMIAGSAFQQLPILKTVLKEAPTKIPKLLGETVPLKATFFITFIMADGWTSLGVEILRPKALTFLLLKNIAFEKDREKAMNPVDLLFNRLFPRVDLYFLLGIVYSVIAPLILPFVITFFGFAYIIYRNQMINVYEQKYESAAAFWPHIHNRVVASMLLQHLTLLGVYNAKGAVTSTPLLVALPIITLGFHLYTRSRFQPMFVQYPLEEARARDVVDKVKHSFPSVVDIVDDAYVHPLLKPQDEADDDLEAVRRKEFEQDSRVMARKRPSKSPEYQKLQPAASI